MTCGITKHITGIEKVDTGVAVQQLVISNINKENQMVQRSQGRRIYRTANGKQVDLDLLISRNELTPAVGNAKVNARGDELGPGGKIIRKREDVMREYYENSATMPTERVVRKKESKPNVPTAEEQAEFEEMDAQWIEDEDGNFIRKNK